MTDSTAVKKDTQRLQRAIIDGLEDVKAQDITVFNTEHLSPLFERVIIASGTSNRQTKALAASVRDAVREAGYAKPRIEGEENGEWIIVDCGAAVAHIMQPAIRTYYQLEQIWGDKPVRLKLGAPKPAMASQVAAKPAASSATSAAGKKAGAKAPAAKPMPVSLRRSSAALKGQRDADAVAKAEAEAAKPKSRRPGRSPKPGAKAPARKGAPSATRSAPVKAAAQPAAKAAVKPAAKSASKPAAKPATKAASKATPKPAAKPAAKPATRSAAKPAAKAPAKKATPAKAPRRPA